MTVAHDPKTDFRCMRLDRVDKGVWTLVLDSPGEKVNTLSVALLGELDQVITEIEADPSALTALVIGSAKSDCFIAGADIKMFADITTPEQGQQLSAQGQDLLNRLETLPVPTVAAIHGACLGGGMELALACRYRMVSSHNATQLGLPEVQLGIIPGMGGTQRLPRLIGIASALDLILNGKKVRAPKAVKMGLAHELVPAEILLERAQLAASRIAEETAQKGHIPLPPSSERRLASTVGSLLLEATVAGRAAIHKKTTQILQAKVGRHYPAPYLALDAVFFSRSHSFEEGLALEARYFGELAVSEVSRNLVSIFFATTALRAEKTKDAEGKVVAPRVAEKACVLGGGLMGGGIATVLMDKGVRVRVKDRDMASASKAVAYASRFLDSKVKKRHIRPYEKDMKLGLLSATDDYSGFKRADVVVEAVFEDLDIKHRVLAEMEAVTGPDCVFATNTSSIPIADVAKGAKRPENVVGMHFFSPVEKMPLLEVIVSPQSSPQAVSTTVALGKKMGKHVIVVNDGPGFYTTRALGAFMHEAIKLLIEGCAVETLDKALTDFGFPVGPMTLVDEVGWDVAKKVIKTLSAAFPERFAVTEAAAQMLASGRLGRKNGKGFYLYDAPAAKGKKAKKEVDASVYDGLPGNRWRNDQAVRIIQERCVYAFMNEAALILQENVLTSPRDGDIGAIFGVGFPPFLGGPFRYMDAIGIDKVVARLRELQGAYSKSFEPAEILVTMAAEGRRFFE